MRRARLPVAALRPWCRLNGVEVDGVVIQELENGQGSGLVADRDSHAEDTVFVRVPRELVLCEELVWEQAKSDSHLRQVLEAAGELAKTAKGAIVIFLLVQLTASSPDVKDKIGLPNPFSDYIKFLPDEAGLPSRWSEAELACLGGTTLENHTKVKMASLQRQYDALRESTASVPWCEKWWWSDDNGVMTFEDLKTADAMFRSRAMDFGDSGLSLVPVMDMANHHNETSNIARYEIDPSTRGALLPLKWGRYVKRGYEVTINYGSDRSASDMLHSYGFIEESLPHAGSMFVSLPPFGDDPLAQAKLVGLELVPGVKFGVDVSGRISFHSPCLWAMVVNEEDGLRVEFAQTNDGDHELLFFFNDRHVRSGEDLHSALQEDLLWNLFNLRAHQYLLTILEELKQKIYVLAEKPLDERLPEGVSQDSHAWKMSERLRDLEYELLSLVVHEFRARVNTLSTSKTVRRWLMGEFQPNSQEIASVSNPTSQASKKGKTTSRVESDGADLPQSADTYPAVGAGWEGEEAKEQDDWDYIPAQPNADEDPGSILDQKAIDERRDVPSRSPHGQEENDSQAVGSSSVSSTDGWEKVTRDSEAPVKGVEVEAAGRELPAYLGRMQFTEIDNIRLTQQVLGAEVKEKAQDVTVHGNGGLPAHILFESSADSEEDFS